MTADDGGLYRLLGPGSPAAPTTALDDDGVLRLWFAPAAVGTAPGGLMTVVEAEHPRGDVPAWRLGIDGAGALVAETASERVELGGPVPLLEWSAVELRTDGGAIRVAALGANARLDVTADLEAGPGAVVGGPAAPGEPDAPGEPGEPETSGESAAIVGPGAVVVLGGAGKDDPLLEFEADPRPIEWYGRFTGLVATREPARPAHELWPPPLPEYDADPDRPRWHFMPPWGWMNEPHGALHHEGRHHVFYQRNELGPFWGAISWGHAVSDNLVDWTDLGSNHIPHLVDVAPDGIWSGSSTIDEAGVPVQFFTAGDNRDAPNQRTAVARPVHPTDPDLREWSVLDRPVTTIHDATDGLAALGMTALPNEFRDPYVWRDGGTWFQLVGAGIEGRGGTALLFSADGPDGPWEFRRPLLVGDFQAHPETGVMWELPGLVPLGPGSDGVDRHVLIASPWWPTPTEHSLLYQWYWVGRWDPAAATFEPDHATPRSLDLGGYFTGGTPSRHPDGRAFVWSITQDLLSDARHLQQGWAGCAGTPLQIWLGPDDDLRFGHPAELEALRPERLPRSPELDAGPLWELGAELDLPEGASATLVVREGDAGRAVTLTVARVEQSTVEIEVTGPPRRGTRSRRIPVLAGEPVSLRVRTDHSVVEAIVAERVSVTTRAWSTGSERARLELRGDARVLDGELWRLRAARMDARRAAD